MTALIRDGRDLVRRLPCAVTDTLSRLENYGHQAVVVGGAVRSLVQGRMPADWDLATSATPDQVMRLFRRVHPTGLKYGTVTVSEGGEQLEVTTFRTDGTYGDGRRPDTVEFGHDLATDLARRDFTINALALDSRGRLNDPCDGLRDLELGLIRAVGDPAARFAEDALRLLRAVRLAAELAFRLESATAAAVKQGAALLARVAPERRLQELRRLLLAKAAGWGLTQLRQMGLWPYIWPGNRLPRQAPAAMASLPFDWELRLAACAVAGRRRVPAPVVAGLRELRLPRRVALRVLSIVRSWPPNWPTASSDASTTAPAATGAAQAEPAAGVGAGGSSQLAEAVIAAGRRVTEDMLWLVRAAGPEEARLAAPAVQALLDSGRPLSIDELAVSGGELVSLGCAAGPKVGKMLQMLLLQAADGNVANEREALLDRARQEFASI